MNELARHQYLEAMGIQSYMPRLVLPAALTSVQCDVAAFEKTSVPDLVKVASSPLPSGVEPTAEIANKITVSSDLAAPAAMESLQSLLGSVVKAGQKTVQKTTAKSMLAIETSLGADTQAPFAVNYWQLSERLAVLADRDTTKALPIVPLLKNIAFAVGADPQRCSPPDIIRWPLEGLSPAQTGLADSYFASILAARFIQQTAPVLLCFGNRIGKLFFDETNSLYKSTSLILQKDIHKDPRDTQQAQCVHLPALEEILLDADLKPSVWNAIQGFASGYALKT